MESRIENAVDRVLHSIFGGIATQVNMIFGMFMLVVGIIICLLPGKMKIVGFIFIGLGCLGLLSGMVQMLL